MSVNSSSRRRRPARRRPVQQRSRATVERIVDAAAHVFAERGYAATTNQIAEAAGLSIGSLYQYFADKDDILVALQARHLDAVGERLIGRGPDDGDAWVEWLVDALVEVNSEPQALVLWDSSRFVPAMRDRVSEIVDALARDAMTALRCRSELKATAVVATALAVVHEVVLPSCTRARRRVAVQAVLAVARS